MVFSLNYNLIILSIRNEYVLNIQIINIYVVLKSGINFLLK